MGRVLGDAGHTQENLRLGEEDKQKLEIETNKHASKRREAEEEVKRLSENLAAL